MTENVCLDNPFIWLDKTEHGPRLHIMNGGKAFNTREYIVDSYDPRDPPEALQRFMTVAHEYGIARLVRHALDELDKEKMIEIRKKITKELVDNIENFDYINDWGECEVPCTTDTKVVIFDGNSFLTLNYTPAIWDEDGPWEWRINDIYLGKVNDLTLHEARMEAIRVLESELLDIKNCLRLEKIKLRFPT